MGQKGSEREQMTLLMKSTVGTATTSGQKRGRQIPADRLMESESQQLVRTIEGEIIPRLMLAHGLLDGRPDADNAPCEGPGDEDVSELARLLLVHGLDTGRAFLRALQTEGMTLEQLFLDLMAPAARHMGQLWSDDRCSFAEVTLALSQLQRMARELGARCNSELEFTAGGRVVLLCSAPEDQHTFGLQMLEECLARAGWSTTRVDPDNVLIERVRSEWTAAIGFSVASDEVFFKLKPVIEEVQKASMNPDIIVMIGGACINERPERAHQAGAAVPLADARSAVLFLQHALLED